MPKSYEIETDNKTKCTNCDEDCHCGSVNVERECEMCTCNNEYYNIYPERKPLIN